MLFCHFFLLILHNLLWKCNETMNYELQINGNEYTITNPEVMGILNCTPDSFYAESRKQTEEDIARRTLEIIDEGGTMVDVGGMSTRPGGTFVTEEEEMARLRFALPIVRAILDEQPMGSHRALLSVDTFRPDVARMAVEEFGADIINDVGAPENKAIQQMAVGTMATDVRPMYRMVARLHVPYILMASEATPEATLSWFKAETEKLRNLGVRDIILDPGYGFGKTLKQNYQHLSSQQELIDYFELPLLAGVSRKRMIWELLGTSPAEALNGTTAINTLALERGAAILRVHDVRPAVEAVRILTAFKS